MNLSISSSKETRMRGSDDQSDWMYSYVSAEKRVPKDHPLRVIRTMVDVVLKDLSPLFETLYAKRGRPSVAPEKLLRALLLQVLYSVRSERMLMEQLDYNLLFRWFVGLSMDDEIWDATVFSKNRDRLLEGEIASAFFERVICHARAQGLLSNEHFTVDGTLIEAWAGQKSFKQKGQNPGNPPDDPGNPTVDFKGEERANDTHQSTTDPDARLYKKARGQESKLCYLGHVTMDNRNGLAVNARVTHATGRAEREAALAMIDELPGDRRITVGGDKAYDTKEFVRAMRLRNVTPHVAQNDRNRRSAIDERTTRHAGYLISQRKRKRVEEIFGWLKTVGMLRKMRHRGLPRVGWMFTFGVAAYNLVRMKNLMGATA
jgi:transposase